MPILWTVYGAAYNGSGARLVYVRTAKRLTILSVTQGRVWDAAPYARASDYWTMYEEDLRTALDEFKRHPKEKQRWMQPELLLEWPPLRPNVIQLQFRFPDEIRFRIAA